MIELRKGLQRNFRKGCAVTATAVFCCSLLPLHAQQIRVSKDNRTIAVTTSAEAKARADRASVHIGYLVYGRDRESAYAAASKASNDIVEALTDAGISKDAIESQSQNITPVQYAPQNWTDEEKVDRKFQVEQSWTAHCAAADAAKVLDRAVKAGANQSGQVGWSVADENALDAKAAAQALERAKQIAGQMARGLNATLGELLYASNEAPLRPREPLMRAMAMSAPAPKAEEVKPLSLSPPEITRSATVHAVFAIQ